MSAFVFNSPVGPLVQTQLKTADVFAALSAAKWTYGWLGGLDSTKLMLGMAKRAFSGDASKKIEQLQLGQSLRLQPITAQILTADGPKPLPLEGSTFCFSDDRLTQLIGFTICALAHETDGETAVQLFMQCMAPGLFSGSDEELANVIHSQLNDASNLERILNEGAAHGFTGLFTRAVEELNISCGDREWLRENLKVLDDLDPVPDEIHMVGGLLKWIVSDKCYTYATRSALVVRVAACLKLIYPTIGRIQTWNGAGKPPNNLGVKAVLLVLGGSTNTDPLMLPPEEIPGCSRTLHYRFNTVGSLLLNALGSRSDVLPEYLQGHFEDVYNHIKENLQIRYEPISDKGRFQIMPIRVEFAWKYSPKTPSARSRGLAGFAFRRSVDMFATCYDPIAGDDEYRTVSNYKDNMANYDGVPEAVCRYRAITAALVLAILGLIAGDSFSKSGHSTTMDLANPQWLDTMCKIVDTALVEGLEYPKAVRALAAIHCAQEPEFDLEASKTCEVAWRRGIYSIVPALLISLSCSAKSTHLQCVDYFLGNLYPRGDGSIRSASTPAMLGAEDIDISMDSNSSAVQALSDPWRGPAHPGPPDAPLYLTFERPIHNTKPDIALVGRIGGSIVGSAGLSDVLGGLLRNHDEPRTCPGHAFPTAVLNIKASKWAEKRYVKPVGSNSRTFVPVQNDDCWALFILGQATYFDGRIAWYCADCTLERSNSSSVVIGYC